MAITERERQIILNAEDGADAVAKLETDFATAQKVFTRVWEAKVRVYMTRDGFYEAQMEKDDSQYRGTGKSPREAIIDALDIDKGAF